ncbi:50S ribosomal protein L19, partial [Hydrogenivirga sp.]
MLYSIFPGGEEMNGVLERVQQRYLPKKEYPNFKVGDTVKVHYRIKEGDRERI